MPRYRAVEPSPGAALVRLYNPQPFGCPGGCCDGSSAARPCLSDPPSHPSIPQEPKKPKQLPPRRTAAQLLTSADQAFETYHTTIMACTFNLLISLMFSLEVVFESAAHGASITCDELIEAGLGIAKKAELHAMIDAWVKGKLRSRVVRIIGDLFESISQEPGHRRILYAFQLNLSWEKQEAVMRALLEREGVVIAMAPETALQKLQRQRIRDAIGLESVHNGDDGEGSVEELKARRDTAQAHANKMQALYERRLCHMIACPVCYEATNDYTRLPCPKGMHYLCEQCMERVMWEGNRSCPVCRHRLPDPVFGPNLPDHISVGP